MPQEGILKYLDNTGEITGLQRFIWDFLPETCVNKTPDFHDKLCRELLMTCRIAEVNEKYERIKVIKPSKYNNFTCATCFRGSSKTTMSTLGFPLYIVCFKGQTSYLRYKGKLWELFIDDDFIIIFSKTNTHAAERTEAIRRNITGNTPITEFFGDFRPIKTLDDNEPWRGDMYCTSNGIYFSPRGAGQQTRGINVGKKSVRGTRYIFDDIYEEDNTSTPEARKKISDWFLLQALNSLDDVKGKATLIGTIVHEDTVLVRIKEESQKKNPIWSYMEQAVMDASEFEWVLDECGYDAYDMTFEMPDDDVIKELEEKCFTLAWPDRLDLKHILNTFRNGLMDKKIDGFYQEYLNRLQSPENKQFKRDMFIKKDLRVVIKDGVNYVYIADEERYVNIDIYIGVDLASSERRNADSTVIMIIGHGADDVIYVLQYVKGKMGPRDETYSKSNVDTFIKEKRDIKKKGVVDEILRKACIEYRHKKIIIEAIQDQAKTVEDVRRVARINNHIARVDSFKPSTNKLERITNTLLGYYQTGAIVHNIGMTDLEHELENLGKAAHDDVVDALHIAVMFSRRPMPIEYCKEEKDKKKTLNLIPDWRVM